MTQKDFTKAVTVDVNAKITADGKKALPETTVDSVIKSAAKVATEKLAAGENIQINGFGVFKTGIRAAREGRNPSTGATMTIPQQNVVKFKAAKALKDALN